MKESLPQRVHVVLRARLYDGSLPPGARLDYKQLALELGVSVTPVREAVTQLASEGFIELIPRLGAIVRKLDRNSAMELFEVREAVETFAAMKSAERHSPRHLEQLRKHLAVMQEALVSPTAHGTVTMDMESHLSFLDADTAFHKTILLGTRNPSLARMAEKSHVHSQIFHAGCSTHGTSRAAAACVEHQAILTALEKRDGPAAAEAMRAHIHSSLTFTLDRLEAALDDD